jgi:hypothetical protein
LDGGFFAGALGAGDFLLFVDYDFFEFVLAVVADVFVDWHGNSSANLLNGNSTIYRATLRLEDISSGSDTHGDSNIRK